MIRPRGRPEVRLKTADTLLLLVLSVIWGSAFLMIDVTVDEVPPLTIVAGRLLVAGAMLSVIARASGHGAPPRNMWVWLFAMAVLNNALPFTLITWAQQHITSSLAATLNATMPLFTFLIAVPIGAESATRERVGGLVVGFIGAAILIAPDVRDVTDSSFVGEIAVIVASLGYSASAVLAREKLSGPPAVLASGQMVIGAALMTPIALLVDGAPDFSISTGAGLSWLGLGVFSSGLAYIIYFGLIQRASATNVALVGYLIPVVATVLGIFVLDEHVGANLFIGLALIILGMTAVNGTLRALVVRREGDRVGVGTPAAD